MEAALFYLAQFDKGLSREAELIYHFLTKYQQFLKCQKICQPFNKMPLTKTNFAAEQLKQKEYFDRKRKPANTYKVGDQVLIQKQDMTQGTSRKLLLPYDGLVIVKKDLPHDRYRLTDMPNSHRSTKTTACSEKVIAVDKMKPWVPSRGVSDDTDSDSGEDSVLLRDYDSDDDSTDHSDE